MIHRQWVVEKHGDAIAKQWPNTALPFVDQSAQCFVVVAQQCDDFFRCICFSNSRKAHQLARDDGDLSTVSLQQGFALRRKEQVSKLRREETTQTLHSVQLRNLLVYALREGCIPARQLIRLATHRVV